MRANTRPRSCSPSGPGSSMAAVLPSLPPTPVNLAEAIARAARTSSRWGWSQAYNGTPADATAAEGEASLVVLTEMLTQQVRELRRMGGRPRRRPASTSASDHNGTEGVWHRLQKQPSTTRSHRRGPGDVRDHPPQAAAGDRRDHHCPGERLGLAHHQRGPRHDGVAVPAGRRPHGGRRRVPAPPHERGRGGQAHHRELRRRPGDLRGRRLLLQRLLHRRAAPARRLHDLADSLPGRTRRASSPTSSTSPTSAPWTPAASRPTPRTTTRRASRPRA